MVATSSRYRWPNETIGQMSEPSDKYVRTFGQVCPNLRTSMSEPSVKCPKRARSVRKYPLFARSTLALIRHATSHPAVRATTRRLGGLYGRVVGI